MNEAGVRDVLKRLRIQVVDELNGWVRSVCPFAPWKHDGGVAENPNFGVTHHDEGDDDEDISRYNCLVCGSKGQLSGLPLTLGKMRNADMDDMRKLSKSIEQQEILGSSETNFGDWEDEPVVAKKDDTRIREFPSRSSFFCHAPAVSEPQALNYLADRGIHFDTVTKLGLRYDAKTERILFPMMDYWTGRYVGCSGRIAWTERKRKREEERATERSLARGGKRIKIPKVRDYGGLEKRKVFLGNYGRNDRGPDQIEPYWIICEGLLAYARFVQLGFGHCTLGLLGSVLTPAKAEILRETGRSIYWFVDPDQGGSKCLYGELDDKGEHKGGGALDVMYGEVVQFIPTWPAGIDDPDKLTSRQQVIDMMHDAELYVKSLTKGKGKSSFSW